MLMYPVLLQPRERELGDGYENVKSMPTWKQLRDILKLQVDFELSKVEYNVCCFMCVCS